MREQHRPRRVRSSRGLVRSSRTTERERVVGGHLQETKPDDRTDREWVWLSEYLDTDVAGERGCDHRARLYRRAVEETDQAYGCEGNIGRTAPWPLSFTGTKSCFGRHSIQCYYLPQFEGKMRVIVVKAQVGMMIRAKYRFLNEWNYDENPYRTYGRLDDHICSLRSNDRAIPSSTFPPNTS
jgi:hypothetical protein